MAAELAAQALVRGALAVVLQGGCGGVYSLVAQPCGCK